MTNESILQQAKDQVAKKSNYSDWKSMEDFLVGDGETQGGRSLYNMRLINAYELAIQSAREEAAPTLSKEDFFKLIGADWNHANANIIWDTLDQHGYKIKKLTAPGR